MLKLFRFRTVAFPSSWKTHLQSSYSSSSSASTEIIVDYLIDSLGFHEDEAVAVSSEVSHLKSASNPELVVNAFQNYGLDNVQIRNIVSLVPKILTIKPTKTLEPKLRVFRELGLPGPDLVTLVKKNQLIFWQGLHTQIIPTVDFLRTLLGSDEKVIEMINRSKWMILPSTTIGRISANIRLLKKHGVSDDKISKLLVTVPELMKRKPELVESKVQYLQQKLGMSCNSPIFIYGLAAVIFRSESEIEQNKQVFRSFGWSDHEIHTLLRAQPKCMSMSQAHIRNKLSFFMKELNFTPSYLIRCTNLWTLSLEKRVKPRNEILKILHERGLLKADLCLATVVKYSESEFFGFLKRFECGIPNLCETYMNSIRNSKAKSF